MAYSRWVSLPPVRPTDLWAVVPHTTYIGSSAVVRYRSTDLTDVHKFQDIARFRNKLDIGPCKCIRGRNESSAHSNEFRVFQSISQARIRKFIRSTATINGLGHFQIYIVKETQYFSIYRVWFALNLK